MALSLRVNGIAEESIVDGPGLRYAIFTQGCPHHCRGCHNPETHDMEGGFFMEIETILAQFDENPLLAGITFSGGEPFLQPEPLCAIADHVKAQGKSVVAYTGYIVEQLEIMAEDNAFIRHVLSQTDILIDGPYIEELRDLELLFRGSTNQRILDMGSRV